MTTGIDKTAKQYKQANIICYKKVIRKYNNVYLVNGLLFKQVISK